MGYLARTARAAYPVQTIGGNVNLTLKSRNKKTGDIPVSTSGRHTCPDACPFKQGPCYAMSGPLALFWDKVSQNQAGVSYDRFLDQVANLPDGQLWRPNQSGDLEPRDGKDRLQPQEASPEPQANGLHRRRQPERSRQESSQ